MTDRNALPDQAQPSPEEALDELLDAGSSPEEGGPATGGSTASSIQVEPTAEELGIELPEDPHEAQRLLLRELLEARQEAGEYLETLQRVAADFDNYRKRVERDYGENVQRAAQRVVEEILPVLDTFDAALAYETQTDSEEKVLEGMRGTHAQLMETLGNEGLEPIEAMGKPFDPAVHEAISAPQAEGDGDLLVTQELRRGYTLRGRVVRPALVIVDHA